MLKAVLLSATGALAAYPQYCAKLTSNNSDDFAVSRTIPPIIDPPVSLSILQVNSFIRHGARTPTTNHQCWATYQPKWDCYLYEDISGEVMSVKDGVTVSQPTRQFRKIYDGENVLGGTCSKGQLLSEGLLQHAILGKLGANAYVQSAEEKQETEPEISSRDLRAEKSKSGMLTDSTKFLGDEISVYFRSTDMQRTRLSGAAYLSSFLRRSKNSELPLHTVDLDIETLFPNSAVCPAIAAADAVTTVSKEWKDLNKSLLPLVKEVKKSIGTNDRINVLWPDGLLDCLMTSVCSDQIDTIPPELRPGSGSQLFERAIDAINQVATLQYTYQDSAMSKAAMTKVLTEMKHRWIQAYNATVESRSQLATDFGLSLDEANEWLDGVHIFEQKDFVLWSGHDTTILPLLSSLNLFDGEWPPYASNVLFELYTSESGPVFRIVYNGKVLRLRDCPSDLCEVRVFFESTRWASPSQVGAVCGDAGSAAPRPSLPTSSCTDWGKVSENVKKYPVLESAGVGVIVGILATMLLSRLKGLTSNSIDVVESS